MLRIPAGSVNARKVLIGMALGVFRGSGQGGVAGLLVLQQVTRRIFWRVIHKAHACLFEQ
jgi:hypothetical protein